MGRGTRLAPYHGHRCGGHEARMQFGITTNTFDAEGDVTESCDDLGGYVCPIDKVLEQFRGAINQVPPVFSAIKIDGEAYTRARRGEAVAMARAVTVHHIECVQFAQQVCSLFDVPRARIFEVLLMTWANHWVRVLTYRLCADTCRPIRCHRRIFFDCTGRLAEHDRISCLRSLADAVGHLQTIQLDASQVVDVRHGKKIRYDYTEVALSALSI